MTCDLTETNWVTATQTSTRVVSGAQGSASWIIGLTSSNTPQRSHIPIKEWQICRFAQLSMAFCNENLQSTPLHSWKSSMRSRRKTFLGGQRATPFLERCLWDLSLEKLSHGKTERTDRICLSPGRFSDEQGSSVGETVHHPVAPYGWNRSGHSGHYRSAFTHRRSNPPSRSNPPKVRTRRVELGAVRRVERRFRRRPKSRTVAPFGRCSVVPRVPHVRSPGPVPPLRKKRGEERQRKRGEEKV